MDANVVEVKFESMEFKRILRGEASEHYVIFNGNGRIGYLHAHHKGNLVSAAVILELTPDSETSDLIHKAVDELIRDIDTDDVLLDIYIGKEIASFSDSVDASERVPTRADLATIEEKINLSANKQSRLIGELSESVVREYFELNGFVARKSTPEEDKNGIDVVVNSNEDEIFVQVKSGSLSYRVINTTLDKMAIYRQKEKKNTTYAFVSSSVPYDLELRRPELERRIGGRVMFIRLSDILAALPRYRRSIG